MYNVITIEALFKNDEKKSFGYLSTNLPSVGVSLELDDDPLDVAFSVGPSLLEKRLVNKFYRIYYILIKSLSEVERCKFCLILKSLTKK